MLPHQAVVTQAAFWYMMFRNRKPWLLVDSLVWIAARYGYRDRLIDLTSGLNFQ